MKIKDSILFQILTRVFKKTKLRTLLMLMILLSFNTTAWFIYATKVENGISARIVAWNVAFLTGEDELLEYINFKIDNIYPGMKEYTEKIEVTNNGDASAALSYEIEDARILDSTYVVDDESVTSVSLLSSLANDYPFKIRIGVSKELVTPGENAYFYVTVFWDYESGNDELDTYWGNKAYDFHQDNKDKESIELNLIISAVQKTDETTE